MTALDLIKCPKQILFLTCAPISELLSNISSLERKAIFVHLFAILHKHWLICINYFIVCIKLFVYLIGIMKFMDKEAKDWLPTVSLRSCVHFYKANLYVKNWPRLLRQVYDSPMLHYFKCGYCDLENVSRQTYISKLQYI